MLTSICQCMKPLAPWWEKMDWRRSNHRMQKQLRRLYFRHTTAIQRTQQASFVIYPQEYCLDKNELSLELWNSTRAERLPSFLGIITALSLGQGTLDIPLGSKEGTRHSLTPDKLSLSSTRAWPVAISKPLSAWKCFLCFWRAWGDMTISPQLPNFPFLICASKPLLKHSQSIFLKFGLLFVLGKKTIKCWWGKRQNNIGIFKHFHYCTWVTMEVRPNGAISPNTS